MAQVFISYSRVDEPFARQLASSLSRLGADVWIDIEDIPTGEKWSRAIQQGLDTAEVMLIIISPDSMASSNVEDEWQYYLDEGKPVIPILYRPAKIHFQLNRIQYVDFHNSPFEKAFRKLHTELAVQGLPLDPLSAAENIPDAPFFAKRHMNLQPMILSMAAVLVVILVVGLILVLSQARNNPTTLTDDPVTNAEKLLGAMSERNFGIADELVCETVNVQESATWGEQLDDIFCHEIEGSSDLVGCSFKISGEEFVVNFLIDNDNRICGQT